MNLKFYIISLIQLFLTFSLNSQVNADSLFSSAIDHSKREEYDDALADAKKVLDIDSSRSDVDVFIANVYAWKMDFNSSKYYLNKAFNINPQNNELYDSWLNVLLWSGEYDELLNKIETAVSYGYHNDYNILLNQLFAYKFLGEYSKAIELFANSRNDAYLDSLMINDLYREILLQQKQNILTAYYSLNYLTGYSPTAQHLGFIDYALKIKQNSLLFRLNYASRFDKNDLQLESDYYQILKKNKYFYLNYGYSLTNNLFPKHRAGIEYFVSRKKHIELSLGGRYLYFPDNSVSIITGSLAKYAGSFLVAIRPYYTINKSGNSATLIADIRKFGKIPLTYCNLELGYGYSPDERYILNQTGNYFLLNSYRFKVGKNLMVKKTDELKLSLGYSFEEILKNDYINRYILEIVYRFRLK